MSVATALTDVLPPEALPEGAATVLGAAARGAEAVVCPSTTEEVVGTLRWAAASEVGVLPVGTGARTRVARREGRFIVLTTDRLTGMEIYEPADVTLTAKAGTPLSSIGTALGAHRQWLPFDPPHVSQRTLGGLVAAGESGPVATGYGELRNHVLGATLVCGDGRVLHLGGRVVKNVAGFDLLRPVVGSRGRLGVITSVCLRAFPLPAEDRVLVHRASDLDGLVAAARAVRTASILPASSAVWSPAGAGEALLLVRLHGAGATVDADQAAIDRHAGIAFERLDDGAPVIAEARDGAVSGAVRVRVSLLPARLFDGLAAARRRLGDCDVFADAYGGGARMAVEGASASALSGLRADVEALGGALSVDGLGDDAVAAQAGSLPSEAERELGSSLERVFDPSGVLWPCRA